MSNLPYNPPFVVPVNVDPALREATPLFTGYAMAALLEIPKDYRGPGRALYKQIMETNEGLFTEMVQVLANAAQYLLESQNVPANQIEGAIEHVLPLVVDGYYGIVIERFSRDFEQSGAINEQQYNDRGVVIRKLQQLITEMENFYRNGDTAQPRGRSYGGSGSVGGTGGWGSGGGARGGRTGGEDVRRAADSVFIDTGRTPAKRDTDNFSAGGRVVRQVLKEPEQIQHKPNVWEGRQFLPMQSGSSSYPLTLNPRRPWDWVVANRDGLMLKPAVVSDWKLTGKEGFTVPWYDPQKAILMHFKDSNSGKIWAQPFQRENDMNYLDHEQDPELRLLAKEEALTRDGKVPPAFQMVESIRPVPGKPLAEMGPVEEEGIDTVVLDVPDTYELANNVRAVYDRHMLRLKVGEDPKDKRAFEFYADIAVLNTVVNPNLNLLGQLADQGDLSRLAAMLNSAAKNERDLELVDIADARMTEAVNHAMAVNMGLKGWAIGSFREDIDECLGLLNSRAGEQSANALKDSADELISATLSHYTASEGHDGVYAALGLGDAVKEDESLLIWRERTSITRIPLSSQDLGLPVEARLVDQNNFPAFYAACEAILTRTPDHPVAFKNRYIALTDGKVYELVVGYYNRSALILKRADFVVAK